MAYAKQKLADLRKEVADRGLSDNPGGIKKAGLVDLLLEDDKKTTQTTTKKTNKKRTLDEEEEEVAFTKKTKKVKTTDDEDEDGDKIPAKTKKEKSNKGGSGDAEWKEKGLLMYFTDFDSSPKIAGFDLDDTLIKTKSGAKFAKNRQDWEWWDPSVPAKLQNLHSDGYKIVIFTNQGGIAGRKKDPALADQLKGKLQDITKKLGIVVHVYMATGEDSYR
eukprot:Phypoly_transcript_19419.p1 GENE.Phypoly_transcript_19419~~Phypoly_transcript_19419.p1  ORF type:complete len:219 (+),score=56.44 Phypoly_transcript_19419:2-658(+)